jgi:hypothetical protein
MRGFSLVTDADLAQARRDVDFRQRLLTESLEGLLAELNKLQRVAPDSERASQLREGAELAVKLADLLRRIAANRIQAGPRLTPPPDQTCLFAQTPYNAARRSIPAGS